MKISGISLIAIFLFNIQAFSQDLNVEAIWKNYLFRAESVEGFRSMNDGTHYTRLNESDGNYFITKYAIADPTENPVNLVNLNDLTIQGKKIEIDDYSFNEDESKILFTVQTTPIYRRSYTAIYYLYDLNTKNLQPLDEMHQPQQLATYSPDGTKIAYIYENNLYQKELSTGKITQITLDGTKNAIINGTTDWVYEEEFAITQAFYWSPDSKYIAYLKFDERNVPEFTLDYYGKLYPVHYNYKYPKAGESNSIVTAHIYSIATKKTEKLNLGAYEYIPRLKWSGTANQLVIQSLNRHQNDLKYHLISLQNKKWNDQVFFEEKADTYIDIDDNLLILSDGKTILRTSESSGFNHIYALTFDGKSRQITFGSHDIIEFYGIDEKRGEIYFSAAKKGAIYKGIYKINVDGNNEHPISIETGTNDAEFTQGMNYFVKTYSNANTPPVYTLCNNEGKELQVLQDNSKLKSLMADYTFSSKEFLTFHSGDHTLNGSMIKPANFDPSKKYPVYMTVYGGPGHNEVSDSWDGNDYFFHQLLAQHGYIVVSVDPRGTMYRGADFKKSTYLQLGKLELEDFVNTAKELKNMEYVDPSRIGIQGWSFGGFMTSLAMTKGEGVFKAGIAVAPVTNWKYYDNIYTERFMRTPQENPDGYQNNSPLNFAKQLNGKFFIIHGSADDNVHYQNTMDMVTALVAANKQFDLFIYPNKNHGIYGGNTRNHLFSMILEYTLKNL